MRPGVGANRERRWWRLAALVGAAAVAGSGVYALWQVRHGGMAAADVVTVLGFPLTVAGFALTISALRGQDQGTAADLAAGQARTLARLVADVEGRVLTQLLGADTERITLHYSLAAARGRAARAPAAGVSVADGTVSAPGIASYYRATRPARLVITGAAGAGKTVLALQLALDLIRDRDDGDPVPLRVPLAGWDPALPLRDLLVSHLVDVYGRSPKTAANLVDHHLVLPVLDGLDEMDPLAPGGVPDPRPLRALWALARLNAYREAGTAGPLVLVCRAAHYDALPPDAALSDAARITVSPVDAPGAVAYLAARAQHPDRWRPLLDELTSHPHDLHARVLSTPWRLCLTATVYAYGGDPAELLALSTAERLDARLLSLYVPATTHVADVTGANPRGYTADQVHRWLHHLAVHLAAGPHVPSGSEIILHRLWPMAGRRRVRATDGVMAALACLLPLAVTLPLHLPGLLTATTVVVAVLTGLSCAAASHSVPLRLDLRGPSVGRSLVFALVLSLLSSVLAGAAFALIGLVTPLPIHLEAGLVIGSAMGLLVLARALTEDQSAWAVPRATIRADALAQLFVGVDLGTMAGLVTGTSHGVRTVLGVALVLAIPLGLLTDAADVLSVTTGPPPADPTPRGGAARRYLAFLLSARGTVPFRLARFLDWASAAGIMRYSGSAYQFRHRELQLWLAAHPEPLTGPGRATTRG